MKSPGTVLDRIQTSPCLTPIQQAFEAVAGASVSWILVSNFDEIRLYRANNTHTHAKMMLSIVFTHDDMRRLCALFSKASLLGERGKVAPLLLLTDG